MRYIPDIVLDLPVPLREKDGSLTPFPKVLLRILEIYQTWEGIRLNTKQIRTLNAVIKSWKESPPGSYVLENAEFDIVHDVVESTGLSLVGGAARNTPGLLDALDACPSARPQIVGGEMVIKTDEVTKPIEDGLKSAKVKAES